MIGLGLFIAFFGYAVLYWGIEGVQGNTQPRFLSYVFPWITSSVSASKTPPAKTPKPNTKGGGGGGSGGGGGGFGG